MLKNLIIVAVMLTTIPTAANANIAEYFESIETGATFIRSDNPRRVKPLSEKSITKAEKKLLGFYQINLDGVDFVVNIFDMATFSPGLLSFGYDVYLGDTVNLNNLLYTDLTGVANFSKKSSTLSFNIPAGQFNVFFGVTLDKKQVAENGVAVTSAALNCDDDLSCTRVLGGISIDVSPFTIEKLKI